MYDESIVSLEQLIGLFLKVVDPTSIDKQGNDIGVAVIDIPYTSIENYLSELHLGENGYAFILNENQEVVFHKDFAYYTDQSLVKSLIELKNQRNALLSDDGIIQSD